MILYECLPRHRSQVPVFSLRSSESVGVGEFLDLIPLVDFASACGMHMIQVSMVLTGRLGLGSIFIFSSSQAPGKVDGAWFDNPRHLKTLE